MPKLPDPEQLLNQGRVRLAALVYKLLVEQSPHDQSLLDRYWNAVTQAGTYEDAVPCLGQAVKQGFTDKQTLFRLATTLFAKGLYQEAHNVLDYLIQEHPGFSHAIGLRAEIFLLQSKPTQAQESLEPHLVGAKTPSQILAPYVRTCVAKKEYDNCILLIQDAVSQCRSNSQSPPLYFALANLLDKAGRYDEAFEAASSAHAMHAITFDANQEHTKVEGLLTAWSAELIGAAPEAREANPRPVYIIGLPRSGTSLVEAILAAHPDVEGAGEVSFVDRMVTEAQLQEILAGNSGDLRISQQSINRMGARLSEQYRMAHDNVPVVTDKNLANHYHIGLLALCAPNSRIIHCVRHPLDVCVSSYLQDFRSGVAFSHQIEHIAEYSLTYQLLVDHWADIQALPILRVQYEDLVTAPEEWAQQIIAHADLPWTPSCLRFFESKRVTRTLSNQQVNKPIYTNSIGRHENYAQHLQPARDVLESAGVFSSMR